MTDFTELKEALARLGDANSDSAVGSGKEAFAVLHALIKMKAAKREFVAKQQQIRDACDAEKERVEMMHLRLQNLHYKRENLLSEIAANEDIKTPNIDAIAKEMLSSSSLGVKKYSDIENLQKTHESVLKVLMKEQMLRKERKLALERKLQEHDKLAVELDAQRAFLDGTLKQKILEVSKTVESVASGFSREEDAEVMSE